MKIRNRKAFLFSIFWLLFIITLHVIPGSEFPKTSWLQGYHLDKLIHLVMFIPLSYGIALSIETKYRISPILFMIVFAMTLEIIQGTFIAGRTSDIKDFIADSLGIFLGLVILKRK